MVEPDESNLHSLGRKTVFLWESFLLNCKNKRSSWTRRGINFCSKRVWDTIFEHFRDKLMYSFNFYNVSLIGRWIKSQSLDGNYRKMPFLQFYFEIKGVISLTALKLIPCINPARGISRNISPSFMVAGFEYRTFFYSKEWCQWYGKIFMFFHQNNIFKY